MAEPMTLWTKVIEPSLPEYMGKIFEDVCRDAVRTGLALPFEPLRVGSWWTRDGKHEVDVVARGLDDELFVGECKWGKVSPDDLQRLKERGRLVAAEIGGVTRLVFGLFSAADDGDEAVREAVRAGDVLYFGLDDLFAP